MERVLVEAAVADAVEGGVHEAELATSVLVSEGDESRLQWGAGAGAATSPDGVLASSGGGDDRHPGVGGSVGSNVGHGPVGPDPRHVVLVAGPREDVSEAAARPLELAAKLPER